MMAMCAMMLLQQLWAALLVFLDCVAEVPGVWEAAWQSLFYFALLGFTFKIRQILSRGQGPLGTQSSFDEYPEQGPKTSQETAVPEALQEPDAEPVPTQEPTIDLGNLKTALGILGLQNRKAHLQAVNTFLDGQMQRLQGQLQEELQEELESYHQRVLALEGRRAEEEQQHLTIVKLLLSTCQGLDSALQARDLYQNIVRSQPTALRRATVCHRRELRRWEQRARESLEAAMAKQMELQKLKVSNRHVRKKLAKWEVKYGLSPHQPVAPGAPP